MLKRIKFDKFTAFEHLEVELSAGINVFLGENGTGKTHILKAAYIPVKDMMANAPGFRSLYEEREIYFEEVYVDIVRKAFLPVLKGPTDKQRKNLSGPEDKLLYHSLYRSQETQEIAIASTDDFISISPNAIDDTFGMIIDREISQSMGGLGK